MLKIKYLLLMILMFTTFGCKGQKEDSIKIKVKKNGYNKK